TGELVAIKRFQSVYRNPVPAPILQALGDEEVNSWPAEIQATIMLGGFEPRGDGPGLNAERDFDILPALDYFLVRDNNCCSKPLTWHLVTPYLSKGTLTHLARTLETRNQTSSALDEFYRPAFHRLLESLSRLHKLGVCHNDVKPDNIYIRDELHWLLGDLFRIDLSSRATSERSTTPTISPRIGTVKANGQTAKPTTSGALSFHT
ncbi:MAG: hypothetical protein Q9192_007463, partial [Flavoplaca navasiana]